MPRAGSRPVALAIALLLTMGLLLSVTPAAAQPGTMCEVITIAELDGLSPLIYDYATADFTGCAYAPADATHSLRIGLAPLGEVKSMPEVFPGGVETLVGDRFAYFIDGSLFVQLVDGTAAIEPVLGDGTESMDALAYATQIAEIVLPRLDGIVTAQVAAAEAAAGPAPATLCDVLSKDELNALSPLQFDDPPGFAADETQCQYDASPLQEGNHGLSLGLTAPGEPSFAITLAKAYGAVELTVADHPAYASDGSLLVEIGDQVLSVLPSLNDSAAGQGMDTDEYAVKIAEVVIGNLEAQE